MQTTEFFKVYGVQERQDQLIRLADNNYLLIVGFGHDEDNENAYHWRKYYDHKPTRKELREDIDALVNAETDLRILTGFSWNGKPVYLSMENQSNFKVAYDLARDTNGANLPIRFKLGEDADGKPVYHTFTKFEPLQDFILKAADFTNTVINEGWKEKDGVDFTALGV